MEDLNKIEGNIHANNFNERQRRRWVLVYSFHDDDEHKVLSYSASVEHEVRGSLKLGKKPLLYGRRGMSAEKTPLSPMCFGKLHIYIYITIMYTYISRFGPYSVPDPFATLLQVAPEAFVRLVFN